MTILEFLREYISTNPFKQAALCTKLKKELTEGAKIHAGWSFFVQMLETKQYGQNLTLSIVDPLYHPCNIDLLAKTILKIGDIEPLLNWLDSFEKNGIKTESLLDVMLSRIHINITDFPIIDYMKMNNLIRSQCDMEPDTDFRKNDGKYHVIPKSHLKPIMDACPYNTWEYKKDSFDCEDFAESTCTWLAQQGLGNATLFYAEINAYDKQPDGPLKYSFAHGINLVIVQAQDGVNECMYWEPKEDKLWKPSDPMKWGWGTKIIKLRHLVQ